MFVFLLTVVGLMVGFDLLWWWRGDVAARRLPRARAWRITLAVFMLLQLAGILLLLLARPLGFDRTGGLPNGVLIFLFVWHLLVLPGTVVLWLLAGVGWSAAQLAALLRTRPPRAAEEVLPRQDHLAYASEAPLAPLANNALSRRQFLATAMVAAPPLVTVIGTGWAVPQLSQFRIRRLTVTLPALPRALDGMTIAHVSDVHVGDFTSGRTLDRIADATNQLRADLVCLTGDLLNRRLSDLPAALDMVRKIDSRHGLFLVEGNHDLFDGREAFQAGVCAGGVPLLVGEAQTVCIRGADVQILGLPWGPRRHGGEAYLAQSMLELLPRRREDAFPILLAHHPHAFDYAARAGIPLTLSGHTHGGQLHLTPDIGFGPMMYRYWSGLYQNGGCATVISNGVGNWFPLRVNAPAEIIHLTLRCGR